MLQNTVKRIAIQDSAIQNSYQIYPCSYVSIIWSIEEKTFYVGHTEKPHNDRLYSAAEAAAPKKDVGQAMQTIDDSISQRVISGR